MGDFDRNAGRRSSSRGRFDRRSGGFGGRGRDRDSDRGRDRDSGRDRRSRSERHEMHEARCDKCSKDCEVPFKPTQGKPIFCDDCFKEKSREAGSRSDFGKPVNNEKFDQINKKLDKILTILETRPVEEQPKSKKPKKVEEEKPKGIEDLPILEEPKSIEKPKKKKAKKKKK